MGFVCAHMHGQFCCFTGKVHFSGSFALDFAKLKRKGNRGSANKAVIIPCGLPQERITLPLITSEPSEVEEKDLV